MVKYSEREFKGQLYSKAVKQTKRIVCISNVNCTSAAGDQVVRCDARPEVSSDIAVWLFFLASADICLARDVGGLLIKGTSAELLDLILDGNN